MFSHSIPLIFCETTGEWAAAARSYLPPDLPVVQTWSLSELADRLAENSAAIAAIEWQTEHAAWLLDQIADLGSQYPSAPLVVLASRSQAAWESATREAGAAHFIVSTRRLLELAEIASHLRRTNELQSLAANDSADLEERILASLPWGH